MPALTAFGYTAEDPKAYGTIYHATVAQVWEGQFLFITQLRGPSTLAQGIHAWDALRETGGAHAGERVKVARWEVPLDEIGQVTWAPAQGGQRGSLEFVRRPTETGKARQLLSTGLGKVFGGGCPQRFEFDQDQQDAFQAIRQAIQPAGAITITCPDCGKQLAESAKFCPECGARLDQPQPSETSPCAGCGAPLDPGAKFCAKCGARVETVG